ncbi:MAG: TAXI family TRAP transporter solute-binding subunit [Bacillota bacterium]
MNINLKKFLLFLCLLLSLTIIITACGGAKEPAPSPQPTENKNESKETKDPRADWPSTLDLGAASIGGAYYVYAGGISTILEEIVGIPTGVEVTGGPNHNMQLVDIGDLDLGLVTMGPAYEAWNGLEDWTGGKQHRNVRAIFPMYSTYSQWWAEKGSGITSIHDLEGKRVGAGPSGGTAGTFHPRFLELLGIKTTIVNAGLSDLVSQHLDKQLDANSFASGVPVAGVLEYSAQKETVMFGIDGEDRDKILAQWPFWSKAVIPADKYDFLDKDLETVAIWNVAIANKDLPESLVYEIVKAIMENNKMMLDAHSAAAETVPQNVGGNTFMWMHPGAIKYFEEIGVKINPDLYPPEYKK